MLVSAAILGLAAVALAQTAQYCPSQDSGVCYSVNVPDQTASSGNGDIFFQISGPSSKQWIGLGQGGQMAGSNIFVIYTDASGTNVTLSPRLGKGEVQPLYDNGTQAFLLEGSGIANGNMTANVRLSNAASWTGGTMDLTSSSASWIWASKSGNPISNDSPSANLQQHSVMDSFKFDLTKARGGSSLNPFVADAANSSSGSSPSTAPTSPAGGSSATPSSASSSDEGGGNEATVNSATIAHGTILGLAFVIFFPFGAFLIRLCSFDGLVWVHAGVQLFGYIMALTGLGLGVYIAIVPTYQLNVYHPIIGLVVICLLIFQPILGLLHHRIYKSMQRTAFWAAAHLWFGRVLVTLGIINGGLGLRLSGNTTGGEIAYGVVAGVMWVSWVAVAVWSHLKPKNGGSHTIDHGKVQGRGPGDSDSNQALGNKDETDTELASFS